MRSTRGIVSIGETGASAGVRFRLWGTPGTGLRGKLWVDHVSNDGSEPIRHCLERYQRTDLLAPDGTEYRIRVRQVPMETEPDWPIRFRVLASNQ